MCEPCELTDQERIGKLEHLVRLLLRLHFDGTSNWGYSYAEITRLRAELDV